MKKFYLFVLMALMTATAFAQPKKGVVNRADLSATSSRFQLAPGKAVAKTTSANVGGEPVKKKPVKKVPKPGRNDPCPCGKMKADGSRRLKYKECCGRNE